MLYVIFKSAKGQSFRAYHQGAGTISYPVAAGSSETVKFLKSRQVTATGDIQSASFNISQAGTVFIGNANGSSEIYAVKFVPTNGKPYRH